jgi:hypothetical protein
MRAAAKRRGIPQGVRDAQRIAVTGRKRAPFSAETLAKMSEAAKFREARKRQEAIQAQTGAFNMAQNFYTAPGLQALGNAPLSYQAGQDQLKLGLGAIGSAVPQMINPDTGANLGMANRANIVAAQGAQASATGSALGGLFQGIGSAVAGIAAGSDIRIKENIRKVGSTDGGLPVYIYNYIGDNVTHMGVMAQDVEKVNPEAVTEMNGYKAVYYDLVK